MQRYFFPIHGGSGTDEDVEGIDLSGPGTAMLHALAMCAEIGSRNGFCASFSVGARDTDGVVVGYVSIVAVAPAPVRRDA
ncbi:MAG: hypothetical protein GC202_12375 [Alphaproteobacteria bacterium]|nr:hypothetical protein [Alphaproteobacteria bacterium]